MAELAVVLLILLPLGLLAYLSLTLLKMGMKASEMTDAARQRLSGCGLLLLIVTVCALFAAASAGIDWMIHLRSRR